MYNNITLEEVFEVSPHYKVTVQDNTQRGFEGTLFESDQEAVSFLANAHPQVSYGKIHIPLALPMLGLYELDDPDSKNRLSKDFRLFLPDRVLAPGADEDCLISPYLVHNALISIELNANDEADDSPFMPVTYARPFSLNIPEPGFKVPQDAETVYPALVSILRPNGMPQDELLERYNTVKQQAGAIIQRVVNNPIFTLT